MIPELREKYNSQFTDKAYQKFLKDLDDEFKVHIEFRIAETPIFIPNDLRDEILKAADEIIATLTNPEFRKYSQNALPEKLAVPNEDDHAAVLALDFAVCKDEDGKFIPQLIELQGFASLFCYQQLLNEKMRENFSIENRLTNYFSGLNSSTYLDEIRSVIVGESDPENVILLEIEPARQKTYIDFLCTEKYLGVKSICLTDISKEGKKLFYTNDGKKVPIERIYNRVIYDELAKRNDLKYDFRFTEELDVKWIAHPNWFFKISKYSLPFFKSKYVPETRFLSDLSEYPDDLENYVLKPLYSFAGAGVMYDVDRKSLDEVKDRHEFILQRKVNYEPAIITPDIPAKAELRLLYIWKDKPLLVNNLVRLSKGKMMGVDFNKEKTWVGSSIAYHF